MLHPVESNKRFAPRIDWSVKERAQAHVHHFYFHSMAFAATGDDWDMDERKAAANKLARIFRQVAPSLNAHTHTGSVIIDGGPLNDLRRAFEAAGYDWSEVKAFCEWRRVIPGDVPKG